MRLGQVEEHAAQLLRLVKERLVQQVPKLPASVQRGVRPAQLTDSKRGVDRRHARLTAVLLPRRARGCILDPGHSTGSLRAGAGPTRCYAFRTATAAEQPP